MPRKKKQEEIIEEEVLLEDEIDENDDETVDEDDDVGETHMTYVDEDDSETVEDFEEEDDETVDEETAAAATLKPNSKPDTKSGMMKTLMNAMSGMAHGDMIKFFDMMMGQHKSFNAPISGGAAASNKASINAKGSPVKEDLEAIFGDNEELSEEFKEKIETIFEATVNARLQVEVARIEEEYAEKIEEEIKEITDSLQEDLDSYLEYAAQEWLEENQVAIDQSLKSDLTESFIQDLGDLCRNYNIDLPESEDDVLETLATKVGELEEALNESEAENIELKEEFNELTKEFIIETIAEEVPAAKYEKFKSMAENIEYEDHEELERKLGHIKESLERKPRSTSTELIKEEIAEDADDADRVIFEDPAVKLIHETISRTAKR